MSAIVRAHGAARWLLVLVSLGFITVAAAVDADATAPEPRLLTRANEPFVIALAIPAAITSVASATVPPSADASAATIAPLISARPASAPARFFTISEVMAKPGNQLQYNPAIQLASTNPAMAATDATAPSINHKGGEPFGLFTFVAPDGQLWTKWRKVADEIRVEEPALAHCLADSKQCSTAAARFAAIIGDARQKSGRARLDLVNERVNDAIRYKSDMAQWGVADLWSPPLAADGTGSFSTGFGDCEDYAIAKYVALRAAGVPAPQLRVLLVHDNAARMDHAVLAALDNGHWYILDNRWMAAVEDAEVRQFAPLFALDDQGVKLLVVPYAAKMPPEIQPMSEVVKGEKQIFVPGGSKAGQSPVSSRRGVTGVGSTPVLM